jgi:hypothetical protein
MATAASQKFSTRVKVPHLDGKGAHGDTHFISSTHYNIKGKAGSRTSVIRYKGEWYVCSENPAKAGSFIQGDKATAGQIPKDAPKAIQTPKQPAKKSTKKAAKPKATKPKATKPKATKPEAAGTKDGADADEKAGADEKATAAAAA